METLISSLEGVQLDLAKFDGVLGQLLMTIERSDNEVVFVFQDNRFMFVNAVNGKLEVTSVPE